jgi:3-hydroxyisobutyrate dehydrogenase-like beta-hydroxyacid dehydrogenase
VSVVGLGLLGRTLAAAFLRAGHATTVWNRTPERADELVAAGATQAASVAEAAAAAPVVVVAVSTYDDVRQALGPAAGELAGRTLVNLSSGTPEQAREMAAWATGLGATYLDGAAMSGTRLVGRPEALFLYSGASGAVTRHGTTLAALGRAVDLGDDPGVASLYDTALLGVNLSVLAGFYQAAALVGTAGVPAARVAEVVVDYLPFATGLIGEHAAQADAGRFPDDDGTLDVYAAAVGHLAATSRGLGVDDTLPAAIGSLLDRAIAAGHARDGLARLADVVAVGAAR